MKRLTALFLLVCMALAVMPAIAEDGFYGSMEIVNCKEWVSLREKPSSSARRLAKLPLGTVVSDCRQHGGGWVFAAYDGHTGYVQEKYLQTCEGVSLCSAMLVTNCMDGTELYETIGSLKPTGFLPVDTLVRNCAVMGSGRAYVEYGVQSGYVSAEHLEPYSELMRYPRQITMHVNLFGGAYEGPAPTLRVVDAKGFPFADYACSEYDFTEYEQPDADTPTAEFVLCPDSAVRCLHLFSASVRSMDMETGEAVYDFVLEDIQYQADPQHPLFVKAVMYGDTPNLAVGYEDWTGAYHFAFVEISGEDGSFLLREF